MNNGLWLKFDIRCPSIAASISSAERCAAAIEQSVWAERNGFDTVLFGEHHGTDDGYLPSPMVLAAAVAARTNRLRLNIGALLLPLHHPLRAAEDICVLDNVSNGRVGVTIGVGYVPSEFAMFDVGLDERAPLVEEGMAALRGAFGAKPFSYRGREVRVSPAPVQPGGPKLLVGGALKASALRATRLGDGFFPTVPGSELPDCYRAECLRLGRPVGPVVTTLLMAVHVSRDPERDWARVGPHMMYEMNCYGRWARESGVSTPFSNLDNVDSLRNIGIYHVVTPDECLALLNAEREAGRIVMFNPMCGGLHPDIASESLELLASEVLPRYQPQSLEREKQCH